MLRAFQQVILRQLRAEKLRTAITVVGVAAGIAVVLAIRLTNASAVRGFGAALEMTSGRAGLEIVGAGFGIDETLLPQLEWLSAYGVTSPVIDADVLVLTGQHRDGRAGGPSLPSSPSGPSSPSSESPTSDLGRDRSPSGPSEPPLRASTNDVGRDGSPSRPLSGRAGGPSLPNSPSGPSLPNSPSGPSGTDSPTGPRTELARVLGVDILRDFPVRDYDVGDVGQHAQRPASAADILGLLTDPDAIVTTRALANRLGLRVGDQLHVIAGDRRRDLRIRGLLEAEGPARLLDGNFLLMDIAAAQWAFDRLGRLDRIDVKLHDGIDIAVAEREIAARLPAGVSVQRPSRRGEQVEQMLAAFHLNLTALSSIALLVGLFLVYNAVSVSVLARRQEIGTLRALGTTRRQIQSLFLGEAAVFGVCGVALGLPLARVLADLTVSLTSRTVNTLYISAAPAPPALGPADVVLALVVGLPLSLLAAWLPAREAAGVPPTAVLRGADRVQARVSPPARSRWVALGLLVIAAASSRLPILAGLPIAGYLASVALVFGAALLMPTALQFAARHGRSFWFRLFRVGGWLAHAGLGGAINRVAVSVAALAVSLAMMVAITVMVGSFRQTVIDWVGQSLKADLFVGPAARRAGARQPTISADVVALVRNHPDVAAVDAFRSITVPYERSLIYMGAGDFAIQARRAGLRFKSVAPGTGSPADVVGVLDAARSAGSVLVSEPFSTRYGKRAGDSVTLQTPRGPIEVPIAAVYFDYSSDRGVVMMDNATLARHFGVQPPTGLTVYVRDGAEPEAVRASLLGQLDGTAGIFIFTNRALRREVLNIFDSTFAVTYALQAIAILVALLGSVGTLMTLVIERRRELGILRAMGASRGQVRAMVVAEAAMLGAISQAAGLVLGLLLALILVYVVNLQSFGWTIHLSIPWSSLAQMSALVVVTTLLAGIYPAQRAMREHAGVLEDE